MRRFNRIACVALLVTPTLLGCAVIDNYSWRAVDYNREAEQAQEQVLLLNVIRASLRRPMQFTALQSVTGSANVSGSISGGATGVRQTPYISLFPLTPSNTNSVLARIGTGTASGSATMGGTATFTVPVLDTQEFYQGILTPIPLQGFDYYLQQGFPAELLFDLFVLKIEVTRLDDGSCRKFTFQNSVRDDLQFGQFQTFIDYLIGSGLATERVKSRVSYGPPILRPASGPANADEAAKMVEAYSKASAAGLDIRQEGRGGNARYRMHKTSNIFRFCFSYPGGPPSNWVAQPNSALFCGHFNRRNEAEQVRDDGPNPEGAQCVPKSLAEKTSPSQVKESVEDFDNRTQGIQENGISEFRGIKLAPEFLKRINRLQQAAVEARPETPRDALFRVSDFAGGLVSFKVFTRSTEGILYYLGEITRRRLFTEFNDVARTTQVKTSLRYGTFPQSDCYDSENEASWQQKSDLVGLSGRRSGVAALGSYYCENLFVLDNKESPADRVINVSYDGMTFGVPKDANKRGRTMQVLELVKQLLALNTSAKQLPSTSVISIVGQ